MKTKSFPQLHWITSREPSRRTAEDNRFLIIVKSESYPDKKPIIVMYQTLFSYDRVFERFIEEGCSPDKVKYADVVAWAIVPSFYQEVTDEQPSSSASL